MKFPTIEPSLFVRPFVHLIEGWNTFWFTPADPTVLGVIRIFGGMLLFYILVASGPLLRSIYAPDGWIDTPTSDILRHESPWVPPNDAWDQPEGTPQGDMSQRVQRPEMSKWPQSREYYQRWNLDPIFTIDMGQPLFSQFFHVTDPFWVDVVHGIALIVAVLFTLGLCTRVVSVLAWVLALGYIHRAPPSLFGMDTMLAIVLLYLMIAPSGATLSLDRLIQRFRVSFTSLSGHRSAPTITLAPSVSANLVLRLFQIHFCIIYLASGAAKMQGAAWHNGTAIWQTMANYQFTPARFEFFTSMLHYLASHRVLFEIVGTGGSLFTFALEIGLPFLIWNPRLRWLMIIGAVMLHTGIALMMGLVAFSLLMIVMLVSFIPAATVRAFLEKLFHGPTRLWLLCNSRPTVGLRVASLVHAFDAWDQVTIVDISQSLRGDDEPAWLPVPAHLSSPQLVAEGGQVFAGSPLLQSLRILVPAALVSWLPGVGRGRRSTATGEDQSEELQEAGSR